MKKRIRRDRIEVLRPPGLDRWVELRQGAFVRAPYPRHWHEEYQLCLVDQGGGELIYRGSAHATPAATLFIVHPGEVHSNDTYAEGCSFRSIYVAAELMQRAAIEAGGSERMLPFFPEPIVEESDITRSFARLHHLLATNGSDLEGETRLIELLVALVRRYSRERTAANGLKRERTAVIRARDYLEAHFAESIRLEDLARVSSLSPYHLNRLFRAEVGMPPHAYQTHLRVTAARRLLLEGRTIAEVAAETGFVDQSHFTRHFRRLLLVSPGEYRSGSKNVQDRTSMIG